MKRIAVFCGTFNPPHREHVRIARELARQFDEVLVIPSGPDGATMPGDVEPYHRAAMADMAFGCWDRVRVVLDDLEDNAFRSPLEWQQRLAADAEVWHVAGSDLFAGATQRDSVFHRRWPDANQWLHSLQFVIVVRPDFPLHPGDYPPHFQRLEGQEPLSSSEIRRRVYEHEPFREWVPPRVADYIERHRLYRGTPVVRQCSFELKQCRFQLIYDEHNEQAVALASQLEPFRSENPELLVVIGGDGTMLRAVRQFWRKRVPFFGVNTGHLGFLLNEGLPHQLGDTKLVLWELPLLYVELSYTDGTRQHAWAFNDTWVERATGQTAWLEVRVDGHVRVPHLVADGALIATAAGSTAYARAMGAVPLPLGTPALLLVGSNVLRPLFWKPVVLPMNAHVTLTTLDPEKRPLQAYVDGVALGNVQRLSARVSNVACVEMVFVPPHDPAAKLAAIQFP
jgi:nicotinate (nicotinamide) nucleotide adenylyltransferase